jgi:hypothetical protein
MWMTRQFTKGFLFCVAAVCILIGIIFPTHLWWLALLGPGLLYSDIKA